MTIILFLFLILLSVPGHKADDCVSMSYSLYPYCTITVHYTGDPPTFQELMKKGSNLRRMEEVQPLLCPCKQGTVDDTCPSRVKEYLKMYHHDNLCKFDFLGDMK